MAHSLGHRPWLTRPVADQYLRGATGHPARHAGDQPATTGTGQMGGQRRSAGPMTRASARCRINGVRDPRRSRSVDSRRSWAASRRWPPSMWDGDGFWPGWSPDSGGGRVPLDDRLAFYSATASSILINGLDVGQPATARRWWGEVADDRQLLRTAQRPRTAGVAAAPLPAADQAPLTAAAQLLDMLDLAEYPSTTLVTTPPPASAGGRAWVSLDPRPSGAVPRQPAGRRRTSRST